MQDTITTEENPLHEYFKKNEGRIIHKWIHYFDIYHRHFKAYRSQKPTVVEFGVSHGGSLHMWRDYFGEEARIIGVDKNKKSKGVEKDGFEIFIGDQADRGFLREVAKEVGPINILIDDGGHKTWQLVPTFEEMYPSVTTPGIYLVEDMHTNYWKTWGGGIRKRSSFMEYSKRLIDYLNAWHIYKKDNGWYFGKKIEVDDFAKSTYSMTYYDSVLVFDKREMSEPVVEKTGTYTWHHDKTKSKYHKK